MNQVEMRAVLVQGKDVLMQALNAIDADIAQLNMKRANGVADIHRQEGAIALMDELMKNETPPDESDGVDEWPEDKPGRDN